MHVLIVGAGAIGQVFGHHLARGGARVDVLVLPAQAAQAREGFPIYRLDRRHGRRAPERFHPAAVLTDPGEVRAGEYDQIWLCLPSPALRGGVLDALAPALAGATVVMLTAALGDREQVLARVPAAHLVHGLISLVSYPAPLAGEALPEPGMACWCPPGARSRFAGPRPLRRAVVAALKAGGLPAAELREEAAISPRTGALVMPHLAALECAGWSLPALRHGDWLELAGEAAAEAQAIVARVEGREEGASSPPPFLMRLLLVLAPSLLPFPVEAYLAFHFAKVGDQTRLNLQAYQAEGRARGLPVTALEALLAQLDAARPATP